MLSTFETGIQTDPAIGAIIAGAWSFLARKGDCVKAGACTAISSATAISPLRNYLKVV